MSGENMTPNDRCVDGLKDLHERCNQNKCLDDFLQSDKSSSLLQCDQISRILSVGTGFGDIENNFISRCKNAEQFVGIEPDSARCEEGRRNISTRHPHIKVTCFDGVFEDYEEPDEKFDIVLLNHVLYHFEDWSSTIKRAAALLRSGGRVFIAISYGGLNAKLGNNGDKKMRKAIEDNDLLYTEEALPDIEIDLTNEGEGYYDFLYLMLSTSATIEERKEIIDKAMQTAVVPGTNIVLGKHKAFIIQK